MPRKTIKKIIGKFRNRVFSEKQKNRFGEKVQVDSSVTVASTAVVEIRYGGEISIDAYTELLDGVLVLSYGGKIKIGKKCSINAYTIVYGHGGVTIGDAVLIAGHCMIIPNNHNYKDKHVAIRDQGSTSKGIVIENDVWIGHGCSILDGVTIGKGAVIAAGSVVNRSVEPYTIYAGVPAKKIKDR
ncbi:MAG TPA: acyltransferase [Bacteroidia bacterium]|jgi:acetyltransferase-like isoleucine patch superfamily enzyme|nr:acyltransferase [Bacteroidia bacterium]